MIGNRVAWLGVVVAVFAMSASASCQQSDGANASPGPERGDAQGLEGLAWLAGCWQSSSATSVTDEQWMSPRAGQMMGMVRRVRNGQVVETERLVIEIVGEQIHYSASPSGQETALFRSPRAAGPDWVFENPDHDFPQRIVYRLTDAETLGAYIEGTIDGQPTKIDFPMRGVPCRMGE